MYFLMVHKVPKTAWSLRTVFQDFTQNLAQYHKLKIHDPTGNRTPITALRTRCPNR